MRPLRRVASAAPSSRSSSASTRTPAARRRRRAMAAAWRTCLSCAFRSSSSHGPKRTAFGPGCASPVSVAPRPLLRHGGLHLGQQQGARYTHPPRARSRSRACTVGWLSHDAHAQVREKLWSVSSLTGQWRWQRQRSLHQPFVASSPPSFASGRELPPPPPSVVPRLASPWCASAPEQLSAVQFSLPEAVKACRHDWMRAALHDWIAREGWARPPAAAASEPRSATKAA